MCHVWRSDIYTKQRQKLLTWPTYPRAVADFWTSFLSVKKLIILKGSIVKCKPKIVNVPWFAGLNRAELPGKVGKETEKLDNQTRITAGYLAKSYWPWKQKYTNSKANSTIFKFALKEIASILHRFPGSCKPFRQSWELQKLDIL